MNLSRVALALGIVLLTACSNLGEKRTELAAAGFQTIPATTPAQLAHLATIKSTKVIPLTGPKGTVYVFADHQKKALMVGSPSEFQLYRKLKIRQRHIDEQLLEAQTNMANADWGAWGPYAGWGFGVASDPY